MRRLKRKYIVITFATTTDAMAAEKFCQEQKLPGKLIPVPQAISAGCGLAWRVPAEDYPILEQCREQWSFTAEQINELEM